MEEEEKKKGCFRLEWRGEQEIWGGGGVKWGEMSLQCCGLRLLPLCRAFDKQSISRAD